MHCRIPFRRDLFLSGMLDMPEGDRSCPLVLLLHGFTGWKEETHITTLAGDLNALGIATLRFDAPGSGESDGTFADDYRLTDYLESIAVVLKFVESDLPVDPNRIGIWGHSMGGFAALAAAVRADNGLRAVCASQPSMGPSDVSEKEEKVWRTTGWATFSNEHFPRIELPYSFYLDRRRYNALNFIGDLAVPSLFIAGTYDDSVPAVEVRMLHDAAHEPKAYKEFPTSHAYKRDPEQLAAINAVAVEFFTREL